VHILSTEQEALSGRFARKDINRFEGLTLGRGPGEIPLLEGCAARFICRTAYEYEGGDHAIFVGQVMEFDRAGRPPLIYHQGQYGRVLPGAALASAALASAADAEDFSRHFLGHQLGRAYVALFGEVRQEYRSRGLTSADYAVLTALGLGEARPAADLLARARGLGAETPESALRDAAASGLVTIEEESVRLSEAGRTILVELTAVAQASQMRVEDRLSPSEIAMLRHLLARIEAPADGGSAA
jgi:3-hydroxy-9,10-secoandrosta-1,3,5(10)-triene-9,17-dione monooxygenase reductase component